MIDSLTIFLSFLLHFQQFSDWNWNSLYYKYLKLKKTFDLKKIILLFFIILIIISSNNYIFSFPDKIARKADVFDCHVVEVGCGPGSLTRSLLNNGVKHVHGVEIDERFLPSLEVSIFSSYSSLIIVLISNLNIFHFCNSYCKFWKLKISS